MRALRHYALLLAATSTAFWFATSRSQSSGDTASGDTASGHQHLASEKLTLAVVIAEAASELEEYAARELCDYVEKLYDIHTTPTEKAPHDVDAILLIGIPTTNPAIRQALGSDACPKLTDQGIVLKRALVGGTPALIVGGGSPQATLWAVYELVERWGVRYLLHSDVLPDDAGEFRLPEQDIVIEPNLRVRQWRVINDFACGPESWGMDDYRPVLNQLAKLRFNRINISTWTYQPFLHFEHQGVARRSAWLWFQFKYPITDDMPGRHLFDDSPEFWNPDLPFEASYDQLNAAAEELVHHLMAHAHARGMECMITANLLEYPPEFKEVLPDAREVKQLGGQTIVPGPKTKPDDPALTDLAATVLQATVNTYPEVDFVQLGMPEHRQWGEFYQEAWQALDAKYGISKITSLEEIIEAARNRPGVLGGSERAVAEAKADLVMLLFYDRLLSERKALTGTSRPDMKFVYCAVAEELFPVLAKILPSGSETLNFLDYTPARVVKRREAIERLVSEKIPATLIFTLHDDNVGLLPALTTGSLHELTKDLRQHGWAGFSTRYWLIGDHDPCVTYMARAAWDETATPETVYRDQVRAACGEAAVEEMLTMLRELEATSVLLEWDGMGVTFPIPGMIMKHWTPGLMPEAYVKARAGYQRALDAARRAREKTPVGNRDYVNYWAGRLEFGVGYLDTIEAFRRGATAEQEGDAAGALQYAREALAKGTSALESYARVARDQSDRGAIATMGEYVYRPLKAKVQELQLASAE
jgi:hypothetical protein